MHCRRILYMAGILLILDGLGDREHPKYGERTPLEYANTPNMDELVREGATGLFVSIGVGIPPGSAAAMLSILGYDPVRDNPGRGVLDALGADVYIPGALAARANLATAKDGEIIDRRAGRLSDPVLLEQIERTLNTIELPEAEARFKITLHYRGVLVIKPKHFQPSANLLSNDPEAPDFSGTLNVQPKTEDAQRTADLVNLWLSEARKRLEEIGGPANYVLLRGFGTQVPSVEPFKEKLGATLAAVSGLTYLKGIAKMVGGAAIDVPEENIEENVKGVLRAIKENKERFDLFVTHIKATDVYGHDGDFEGKAKAIEYIDRELVGPLRDALDPESDVLAITGDHSTPVTERRHTGDPVPLLIWGRGVRKDRSQVFGEHECMYGGLGLLRRDELVRTVVDLLGKSRRTGA